MKAVVVLTICLLGVVCTIGAPADNTPEGSTTKAPVMKDDSSQHKDCSQKNGVSSHEAMVVDLAMRLNDAAKNMTEKEKDFLDDLLSKSCDEDEDEEEESRRKKRGTCSIECKKGSCTGSVSCRCTWWGGRPKCN